MVLLLLGRSQTLIEHAKRRLIIYLIIVFRGFIIKSSTTGKKKLFNYIITWDVFRVTERTWRHAMHPSFKPTKMGNNN